MIQMGTMLTVADNSGAKKICCILPLGGGVGRIAPKSWMAHRSKIALARVLCNTT